MQSIGVGSGGGAGGHVPPNFSTGGGHRESPTSLETQILST